MSCLGTISPPEMENRVFAAVQTDDRRGKCRGLGSPVGLQFENVSRESRGTNGVSWERLKRFGRLYDNYEGPASSFLPNLAN